MSLVVLEDVALGYGGRTLFSSLNARVDSGERIGVVGRNGSGKSSLLKLIVGSVEASRGSIRRSRGSHIGYLPQELADLSGRTLLSYVVSSVPGRDTLEHDIDEVQEGLESSTDEDEQMELSQRLVDLHERLADFELEFGEHVARTILQGLGFKASDMHTDIGELSGGWRMRAVLSALLFQRPDVLLLDEPTNHLDVPSVVWLGDFLRRYKGAFLLICHDRDFLNDQVRRVISFETEGVRHYRGNYEAYVVARAEELEILEKRAANIAREREQAERFISRFRAQATKAKAVQSRIKAVEKLDEIVLPQKAKSLTFRFPPCERAGQDVVKLKSVSHDYGSGEVFSDVTLNVRRGDRIAIVGANGNGKTTLLRIMAGQLHPTGGSSSLGYNVKPAYYAQHVAAQLDVRSTVFDDIWRHSAVDDVTRVRTALGTMLFSGDDVDKLIGVLSGGEKARVALARILVDPGNLILMDEPTNHLDLQSSEALAAALETFGGSILFVSHNRSFVNRLANRIWDVSNGTVVEFPGSLTEYMQHCAGRGEPMSAEASASPFAARAESAKSAEPAAATEKTVPAPDTVAQPKRKRINPARVRAHRKKVTELEERIAAIETQQEARSSELSKPEIYDDQARYTELLNSYRDDAAKVEELMSRWESAQAELAEME
jgi:ATP-binding cassette subfamily F protein 3